MVSYGQTVTRLRAPLVADPYSGKATKRDWDNAVPTQIDGFAIDPGGSVETATVNRVQTVTTPTLYGPYAADIVGTDRVRDAAGTVWEIDGRRADWQHPRTGRKAGSVWPLKLVEG